MPWITGFDVVTDANLPGFYGKLPALGDFVTRRLPREFIEPWDQWLQDGITASRMQMGSEWLPAYLSAPIWRFALAPDICGHYAWAGALMPSVDRVGRYFPLTMAAKQPGNPYALICGVDGCDRWFDRVEETLLSVLGEDTKDVDHFDEQARALKTDWTLDNNASAALPFTEDDTISGWLIPVPSVVARTAADLLAHFLQERFGKPSVWWTRGAERVESCLFLCQGLPSASSFAGMLDARSRVGARPGGLPLQSNEPVEQLQEKGT